MGIYESDFYNILSGVNLGNCEEINDITELDSFLIDYKLYLEKIMEIVNAKRKEKINYFLFAYGVVAFGIFFYFVYRLINIFNIKLFDFKA